MKRLGDGVTATQADRANSAALGSDPRVNVRWPVASFGLVWVARDNVRGRA